MENLDYFISIANSGNGLSAQSKGKIIDAKTGKILPKDYVISVDMELRNIKHPKLIDYKKEFSQEDIQKLIG